MLKTFVLAFFCFVAHAQYTATSTHFIPTPIDLDWTDRILGGVGIQPSPSIDLEVAYLYKIWDGFDIGIGLHGGVTGQNTTGGILGTDVLMRYVRPLGRSFFTGIQGQIGLVYTGLGDVSKAINVGTAFPVTVGVVLGGTLRGSTQLYVFPALQLGQTMNAGDALWKSGIGLQLSLGTTIILNDLMRWVIEVTPEISNFTGAESAWKTVNVVGWMGLIFDL